MSDERDRLLAAIVQHAQEHGISELGSVRLFKTGEHRSYEELVELVPNRRLSYALVPPHNLPFATYRADVDIDGGTIRWHSQFTMKRRGRVPRQRVRLASTRSTNGCRSERLVPA